MPAPDSAPDRALTIGIIMDGNGRWAQARGLPITEGHREGGRALRRCVEAALDLPVQQLVVYAFSTENWQRDPNEVAGIMLLFDELLTREAPELHDRGVRIRFVGRTDEVAPHLVDRMRWARQMTERNQRLDLMIAFNYGGRAEIVDAVNRALARRAGDGLRGPMDEDELAGCLYDEELAEPDMIIRTGGEQRLSNFLLWQSAYSELVFTERLWPEFDAADLAAAIEEYAHRERRFGGRSERVAAGAGS